jgi:hypothetical protein
MQTLFDVFGRDTPREVDKQAGFVPPAWWTDDDDAAAQGMAAMQQLRR